MTRLDDDAVVGYAGTDPILQPPAIAVGTDGSATVGQVGPDRVLHILTLVGRDLASSSFELA